MSGLLVSVRSAEEAELALAGGASVIDVKEPANGALGRAADSARRAVLDAVAGRVPVSAALGELIDAEERIDTTGLDFVKFGLAGCSGIDWRRALAGRRERVETLGGCRLVFAGYADWRRARAPRPAELCEFALLERARVLLLDTWQKDGSSLLDWLSLDEVSELAGMCMATGVRVALAGSLDERSIRALLPVAPDWFAVRGAACVRGERASGIDPERVRGLAWMLR